MWSQEASGGERLRWRLDDDDSERLERGADPVDHVLIDAELPEHGHEVQGVAAQGCPNRPGLTTPRRTTGDPPASLFATPSAQSRSHHRRWSRTQRLAKPHSPRGDSAASDAIHMVLVLRPLLRRWNLRAAETAITERRVRQSQRATRMKIWVRVLRQKIPVTFLSAMKLQRSTPSQAGVRAGHRCGPDAYPP